jgi:tRNA (guanine9-N1)-methyltransferase
VQLLLGSLWNTEGGEQIVVSHGQIIPFSLISVTMSALGSEEPESFDPTDIPQNDADESTKDEPAAEPEPAKMSKKAMKKAAKAEHYQVIKLERRAREKQMRKEKKKIKAQKRAAGELEEDDAAEQEERERKRQKMSGFGGKVVLDLAFDEMMSGKASFLLPSNLQWLIKLGIQEINSLCSQLAYTYSANRNASYPFSLLYTSLNGRTRDRLEAMNNAAYSRWTKTEWWPDSYERLWSSETDVKKSIVYLTADSTEELEELLPDETYIIGAIVDRNRYKVCSHFVF